MNDPLGDKLQRYYDRFDRDHDRLRSEMLGSLPVRAGGSDRRTTRGGALFARLGALGAGRFGKVAAAAAVVVAATVWVLCWAPMPAIAAQAFADVLTQVRNARTVRYSTRLTLAGHEPQTACVQFAADGRERKTLSDGGVQIADYAAGRVLFIAPPAQGWSLRVACPPTSTDADTPNPLRRLATLAEGAGRFIGVREYDDRTVHVYEVADGNQRMTLWADANARPVRIEIVSATRTAPDAPGATLVMEQFEWDVELDEGLFTALDAPATGEQYRLTLIDQTQPPAEADLVAMLALLAEAAGGVFPASIDDPEWLSAAATAGESAVAVLDLAAGLVVVAGTGPSVGPEGEPAMVQYLRDQQRNVQLRRGLQFIDRLVGEQRPFRYVGEGVRQGGPHRVFWYKPRGAVTYRMVHADGSVTDVAAKNPIEAGK